MSDKAYFILLMAMLFFGYHAKQEVEISLAFVLVIFAVMAGFLVAYLAIGGALWVLLVLLFREHAPGYNPAKGCLLPLYNVIFSIGLLVAAAEFWANGNISWSGGALLSLFLIWVLFFEECYD